MFFTIWLFLKDGTMLNTDVYDQLFSFDIMFTFIHIYTFYEQKYMDI